MTDPTDPTTSTHQADPGPPPPQPPPTPNVTWRPPRERDSNLASIVIGLILVAIGAWYFLEQTLGIRLPRISWRDIWPVLLILLGVFVIIRTMSRRS
jgi:hypothetical protein